MYSLRPVRVLAFTVAVAAFSPYRSVRLYSTGGSKRLTLASTPSAKAAAARRKGAASKPSEAAEAEAKSSWVNPTQTPYRVVTKMAAEALGEEETVRWPKPSEIPFQAKVANSVNLSGHIHMPVQFQAAPDGKSWARTVITQNQSSDSPALWIPVTFEGDLAHIAVSHLKKNDHVFIEGELSADYPAFGEKPGQTNIQVMVHNINFVEESQKKPPIAQKQPIAHHTYEKPVAAKQANSFNDVKNKFEDYWRDLLDSPEEWLDNRKAKQDGSLSKKFPDFKRKDKTAALWIDSAPGWALANIERIEFDVPAKENKVDDPWKDLVENPDKWWDNRSTKTNAKYPDFKHKETGQALWLDSSPPWVRSKLPPLKPAEEVASAWSKAAQQQSVKS